MNERSDVLVRRKFRQYLVPALMTSFVFSMGCLLETVMVGHFLEDTALAAIALANPIALLIDAVYLRFSVGGVTCATVALGKLDRPKANRIFTLCVLGGMGAMMLLWLAMECLLEPLVLFLAGGDAQLAALTVSYLRPMLCTGPVLMFSCTIADFINVDGKPRYATGVFITAGVVRLAVGYVLLRHMRIGLWGAGFAAFAGYAAASLVVIPYLCGKRRSFRFVRPDKSVFSELLPIANAGMSSGWLGTCELVCSSLLLVLISKNMGDSGLSVLMVCMNITVIADVFIDGVTDTLIPIAGVLYGEKDYFGIRQSVKFARNLLLGLCTLVMLIFLAAPQIAWILFDVDSLEVMEQLKPALRAYVLYLPLHALSVLLQYYYNTIGRIKLASLLAALKSVVFLLLFALLLMNVLPDLFWLCYLFSQISALLVLFMVTRWLKKKEELGDLFLLPARNAESIGMDVTIVASVEEAVSLSRRIVAFGQRTSAPKSLINHIAVAVEEMTISAATYAHGDGEEGLVDVAVRVTETNVFVRFRDNGTPFNPVEYMPPEDQSIADGIVLIKKLAAEMKYARQLGFNTTLLTFDR